MNRRALIWCSVLASLLLAAICWIFIELFSDDIFSAKKETMDSRTEILCAVPSDAVAIYEMNHLSDAEGICSLFASDFYELLSIIPDEAGKLKGALSVHYTGKNEISLLACCSIPETQDQNELLESILGRCTSVTEKRYDSNIIYITSVPGINFALTGHYLLMSPSVMLVESSLRHLESRQSLLDNPVFIQAISRAWSGNVFYLNNGNAGKLFSGAFRPFYRQYASFTSHIADWTAFDVRQDEDGILSGYGAFFNSGTSYSYSSVFSGQSGERSDVTSFLPHNTVSYVTVRFSDPEKFASDYGFFYSSWKKRKLSTSAEIRQASSAGITELVKAVLRTDSGDKPVVLMRVSDSRVLFSGGDRPDSCKFTSLASSLAGDFFSVPDTAFCFCPDRHWVAIAPRPVLDAYRNAITGVNSFPLSEWISQTPAGLGDEGRDVVLSVSVNLSSMKDSLGAYLKPHYAGPLYSLITDHNFSFLTLTVNADGGKVIPEYSLYLQNLDRMPVRREQIRSAEGADLSADFVPEIPAGPFEVKDFRSGKLNTFCRTDDGKLILKDHNGKKLWSVPFEGELCGFVPQIDYLKNNKLQMLFASGTKLYLMTRLGGWVKPYPVDTGKEIMLGPAIYDFSGDKNYVIMVLHSDNTLSAYDRDGAKLAGWNDITMPEPIVALPEPLTVGTHQLWVVRSTGQTAIFGADGLPAADFTRRKRLAPDTGVDVLSQNEVKVTTADGRNVRLNIETGDITKIR